MAINSVLVILFAWISDYSTNWLTEGSSERSEDEEVMVGNHDRWSRSKWIID